MRRKAAQLAAVVVSMFMATAAYALDFSFTGTFATDDQHQLFSFTVGAPSTVTLRTWSYAGGVNAAGQTIPEGGFDPILALFDSTGTLTGQNNDGGCGLVAADSRTGQCWDAYFPETLAPGTYTASLMEFDNFANGPTLAGENINAYASARRRPEPSVTPARQRSPPSA